MQLSTVEATNTDSIGQCFRLLPDELIEAILKLVNNEDLLAFAQTSRNMRRLALPAWLSRGCIATPLSNEVSAYTSSEHRALRMLGSLYPMHTLDHLAVNVAYCNRYATSSLQSIEDFIRSLSYLRSFSLSLPFLHGSKHAHAAGMHSHPELYTRLSSVFGALDGKLHYQLNVNGYYSFAGTSGSGLTDGCITARPLRSLSVAQFQGNFVFCPNVSQWFAETLNASPLVELIFRMGHPTYSIPHAGGLFLHKLKLSKLRKLQMDGCLIVSHAALTSFLLSLSQLSELAFTGDMARLFTGLQTSPLPRRALPNLNRLEAAPEVAFYILAKGAAAKFTALHLVNVGQFTGSLAYSTGNLCGILFKAIANRQAMMTLKITFSRLSRTLIAVTTPFLRKKRAEAKLAYIKNLAIVDWGTGEGSDADPVCTAPANLPHVKRA